MVLVISTIGAGTLNSKLVHPREVFKMAILSNAAGFIWLTTILVAILPRVKRTLP